MPDHSRSPQLLRPWLMGVIVFTVVCIANVQAPQTREFHYDDGHSLVRNQHLRSPVDVSGFFTSADRFGENPNDLMYRPLVLVVHSLNLASTGLTPGAFVLVNVIIHAATAACVAWWLAMILPAGAGMVAGLLFGLHPLQSEVVHYVSARSESLAGFFVVLCVAAFTHLHRTNVADNRGSSHALWQGISIGAFFLGLLCKATAIVAPALILLVSMRLGRSRLSAPKWQTLLPYIVISFFYVILHQWITASTSDDTVRPFLFQMFTQAKALTYYVTGVVMPVRLSILPQFSLSQQLEPAVLSSLMVAGSLAVVCWITRAHLPLLRGIGWFVACLAPTLLVPLNILVNDHRPYLALAGLIWMTVELIPTRLPRSGEWLQMRSLAVTGTLAILLVLTWQRSSTWQTERSLWADAVAKGPQMAISQYNLGFAQHIAGQSDSAIDHYLTALRIEPDYVRPLNNLAALLRDRGELTQARQTLLRAAELEPENAEVLNNLGLVLTASGDPQGAVEILLRASRLSPATGEIWLNLGLAQRDLGSRAEAMKSLQRALQLDPTLRQRLTPGQS